MRTADTIRGEALEGTGGMVSQPSGNSHVEFGISGGQRIELNESPDGVDEMGENGKRERAILIDAGMLAELSLNILLASTGESAGVKEQSTQQLRRNERMSGSRRIAMNVRYGNPTRKSIRKVRRSEKRETGNTKEVLRINGLDLLNREIVARRNVMNGITRQPRESRHWLNIRLSARTLGSVNHLSTVRRNVKVVEIGPNRTRGEKSLRRNNRSEPYIEKRRIGRKEVTHIRLRHIMTGITKENRGSRNRRERKRSFGNRLGRISKEVLGRENGINESEARRLIRSVRGVREVELAISRIFARNNGSGMPENVWDGVVHHSVLDSTVERMSGVLGGRSRIIDANGLSELGDGTSEIVGTKSANLVALND